MRLMAKSVLFPLMEFARFRIHRIWHDSSTESRIATLSAPKA